ncbi:MAG: hypothetical protein K1X79_13075 [Oligoflexia bacterium]|nr:hypothetical protein [Oligoflexia bacterium]
MSQIPQQIVFSRPVTIMSWLDILAQDLKGKRLLFVSLCYLLLGLSVLLLWTQQHTALTLLIAAVTLVLAAWYPLRWAFFRWRWVDLPPNSAIIGARNGMLVIMRELEAVRSKGLQDLKDPTLVLFKPWNEQPLDVAFTAFGRSAMVRLWLTLELRSINLLSLPRLHSIEMAEIHSALAQAMQHVVQEIGWWNAETTRIPQIDQRIEAAANTSNLFTDKLVRMRILSLQALEPQKT